MSRPRDVDFVNDVRAAVAESSSRRAWMLLAAISGLIVAALAWSHRAVVEEVTSGAGRIVPSRQLQVVQSLEGGIVREILVKEGERVVQGQVLMRIDDTSFASRLGELASRQQALLAEVARLDAEAAMRAEPSFPEIVKARMPAAVEAERQAFLARRIKLDGEESVLRQQLNQREQELAELAARRGKLDAQLRPLARELALNRDLSKRGAVTEVEILRLERLHAELTGDRAVIGSSILRAESAIEEAKGRIGTVRKSFEAQVRERLAAARGELAVVEQSIKAAEDRVVRAALASPVIGVVNKLNVTTVGAVLQPGQPLAEIVPLDDSLLVETRVRPQDVAFISPGQKASIKISAYDYLVYGALEGHVERISADTLPDPKGETFYVVMVRTDLSQLTGRGRSLPVIPGMVARVDILTGQKTVLSYLVKPLLRARHEALRER